MKAAGISVVVLVVALAAAASARAGGIADHTCPNVAGEYTNTCPSGTVGTQYAIRFVESEEAGCGPGRQTFHLDSGLTPPGLTLRTDGSLSGTPVRAGTYRFYVQMREPTDDPASCAGKRTEKQFTLRMRNPVSVVTPAPSLLRAEVGGALRLILRARGGTGVYAWRITDGALPDGVSPCAPRGASRRPSPSRRLPVHGESAGHGGPRPHLDGDAAGRPEAPAADRADPCRTDRQGVPRGPEGVRWCREPGVGGRSRPASPRDPPRARRRTPRRDAAGERHVPPDDRGARRARSPVRQAVPPYGAHPHASAGALPVRLLTSGRSS